MGVVGKGEVLAGLGELHRLADAFNVNGVDSAAEMFCVRRGLDASGYGRAEAASIPGHVPARILHPELPAHVNVVGIGQHHNIDVPGCRVVPDGTAMDGDWC